MILAVDAAHWWGPIGYFYRGILDNVLASAVWGPVGLIVGALWERSKVVAPIHARLDKQDTQVADLHEKADRIHEHLGIQPKEQHGQ